MPAGGSDLERPPRLRLPLHVGEVGPVGALRARHAFDAHQALLPREVRAYLQGATPPDARRHRGRARPLAPTTPAARRRGRRGAQPASSRAPRGQGAVPRRGRAPPRTPAPARAFGGTCRVAARMPSAMGRSKRPLSLGRSAGARFTMTRLCGKSKRAVARAARTRSRASRTSVSGSPTTWKPGRPPPTWTSTRTGGACMPARPRERTTASDKRTPCPEAAMEHASRLVGGEPRCGRGDFRFPPAHPVAGAGFSETGGEFARGLSSGSTPCLRTQLTVRLGMS